MISYKQRMVSDVVNIICPVCDTAFRLDAHLLGASGRKVRCAACQHVWRAYVDDATPAQSDSAHERSSEAPVPSADDTETPVASAKSGRHARMQADDDGAGVPPSSDDDKVPKAFSGELDPPRTADSDPSSLDDPTSSQISGSGNPALHQPSTARPQSEEYVLRAPLEGRSRRVAWVLLGMACAIVFVCAAYLWRQTIVRHVPTLAPIYRAVGLHVPTGRAFQLYNTSWTIGEQGGTPTVIVRGEAYNTTQEVQDAPTVKVTVRGRGLCREGGTMTRLHRNPRVARKDGTCVVDEWHTRVDDGRALPGQAFKFETARPFDRRFHIQSVLLSVQPQ